MPENLVLLKVSVIVWLLFMFSVCLISIEKFRDNLKCCLCFFSRYSGLTFIGRKFVPNKKNILPSGVIWIVGIYFAVYAFTAQRYESQLDKVELQYTIFTTQVAAGATFSNQRLMRILNTNIPIKPYVSIVKFCSVYKSFRNDIYHESFFYSYGYSSASEFQSDIIGQWKNKLERSDFSAAMLVGTDLEGVNFKGANFKGAILKEVNFSHANLEGANFSEANFEGINFKGARLKGANFSSAKLKEADFRSLNLEGVRFTNAKANKALFCCANLMKTDFRFTILESANFGHANLMEANFEHAFLKKAILGSAKLEGANFEYANLEGADFTEIWAFVECFEGVDLEYVSGYSEKFLFPPKKPITAEQLIMADNTFGLKNVPRGVKMKIKKYGCENILTERPNKWTKEFKRNRTLIIWQFDPYWDGVGRVGTNSVEKINSE